MGENGSRLYSQVLVESRHFTLHGSTKLNMSVGQADNDREALDSAQEIEDISRGVFELCVQANGSLYDANGLTGDAEDLARVDRFEIASWLDFEVRAAFKEMAQCPCCFGSNKGHWRKWKTDHVWRAMGQNVPLKQAEDSGDTMRDSGLSVGLSASDIAEKWLHWNNLRPRIRGGSLSKYVERSDWCCVKSGVSQK